MRKGFVDAVLLAAGEFFFQDAHDAVAKVAVEGKVAGADDDAVQFNFVAIKSLDITMALDHFHGAGVFQQQTENASKTKTLFLSEKNAELHSAHF